ncbi:MAG: response regulator [Candidatus Omnitrophica bacterium]|nr:response regulator [Candidatus Omnitrophota bacterium]
MSFTEGSILVIVEDAQTRELLAALLTGEGYSVQACSTQAEAMEVLEKQQFNLVVCDFVSVSVRGIEIAKHIRAKFNLRHLSIIMIIDTKNPINKIKGIYAGADDYVEKPFEPAEFLARVKASFVRMTRDLDANPLTKLPGNISVFKEIELRIKSHVLFAVGYCDLNKFKEFNDNYGFEMGDKVIVYTAQAIMRSLKRFGEVDDFLGHIGGDDFIFITSVDRWEDICKEIVVEFDKNRKEFLSAEDIERGYLVAKNRKGEEGQIPLLGISIAVVTNEYRTFSHVAQLSQIAAELKHYAKSLGGSVYVKDRRKSEDEAL